MIDEGDDGARVGLWVTLGVVALLLRGFPEAPGDPAINAELAKERAKAVGEALVAAGVDCARLNRPPRAAADGLIPRG